jgi:hypothetical protein
MREPKYEKTRKPRRPSRSQFWMIVIIFLISVGISLQSLEFASLPIRKAKIVNVAFNTPTSMMLSDIAGIQLLMSPGEDFETLK